VMSVETGAVGSTWTTCGSKFYFPRNAGPKMYKKKVQGTSWKRPITICPKKSRKERKALIGGELTEAEGW